jgi:hypothetical protein
MQSVKNVRLLPARGKHLMDGRVPAELDGVKLRVIPTDPFVAR